MNRLALLVVALGACGDGRSSTGIDGGGGGSGAPAVALPQAIAGAMWADPDAYPQIPLHVTVAGSPAAVTVAIDDADPVAATQDAAGWTAQLDISQLADGFHAVAVTAGGAGTTAQLGIGHQGIQLTDFTTDRNAETPRLHRVGGHLFATWTDLSIGARVAWLEELDGAGRAIPNTRVALAGGSGQPDVIYARTAFGAQAIAVLFQEPGGPYQSFFTLVGPDGASRLAPVALDPADRFGSYGGDVVYDGSAGFDVTWRTNDGSGTSDVRWMHVDEATGAITGPLVAAAPGHDDPHGGFDAITNVAVRHAGAASLVAFSRYEYSALLQLEVMRCQVATITGGAVARTDFAENGSALNWDDDCRILDGGDQGPVLVWAAKSLTSSADDPPDDFFGARAGATDGALAASRGDGAMILDAPESREEPWLVPTSAAPILAWSDARSYATSIATGQVQLYAAPLAGDLSAGSNVLFAHTHFIENTAEIHGAAAGTNAILTWVDERHGGTVTDPRPEIYLETVWQ